MLPLAILVALGIDVVWRALVTRRSERRLLNVSGSRGIALAIAGGLSVSVALVWHDYFDVWGRLPHLPETFHEEMAKVGRYIGQLPQETVVYMTPTQKYYATILLAMGERERPRDFYGPVGLLPAGDPSRGVAYVILEGDETTAKSLETIFPQGRWDVRHDVFCAYYLSPDAQRVQPAEMLPADFGVLRLIGFEMLNQEAHPGGALSLRLFWQASGEIKHSYTAFVHLLGPPNAASGNALWAQDDHEPGLGTYTTERWFRGEIVMDVFHVQIPPDAPAGTYVLATGFYDLTSMRRLPRRDVSEDTAQLFTLVLGEQTP